MGSKGNGKGQNGAPPPLSGGGSAGPESQLGHAPTLVLRSSSVSGAGRGTSNHRPAPGKTGRKDEFQAKFLSLPLRAATSLLLLGLFAEWLLPLSGLPDWNGTFTLTELIIAAASFLAVGVPLLPSWSSLLLRSVILIAAAGWLTGAREGWLPWLSALPSQLAGDLAGGFADGISRSWQAITLFIGLSLLLSALQMLVWIRQWGLGLTVVTGLYLFALYQWLGIDPLGGLHPHCR